MLDYKKLNQLVKKEFTEDEYYLVFVLGYDLLHDEIMKCENKCCDDVFDTMKEIIKLFLKSEECKNLAYSTYEALQLFLRNHKHDVKMILFNNLDYDLEEMLC